MPPKSILKKRPLAVESDVIEEVPVSGPSADRGMKEPESETGSEDDDMDSDDDILEGDSDDEEEEDEEDEEAIREMGEGKLRPPKSESTP